MNINVSSKLLKMDSFGACLSFACAIHCLAIPLLVNISAIAGLHFLLNEEVEVIFVVLAITAALLTHSLGFVLHGRLTTFIGLGIGIIFIVFGKFFENPSEIMFVVVGGIALSISHLVNRHLCKICPECASGGTHKRHH